MDKDTVNKIIHEARGLCWHEPTPNTLSGGAFDIYHPDGVYLCRKCGLKSDFIFKFENPDYHTPEGFFSCWDWAKEQEFFDRFLDAIEWGSFYDDGMGAYKHNVSMVNQTIFALILAEWLKEAQA